MFRVLENRTILVAAACILVLGIVAVFYSGYFQAEPFTKVVVVGKASPELEYLLQTETVRYMGVTFAGSISPDVVMPRSLDFFDVVIVAGEKECNRDARDTFQEYLEKGGFMILVGDACTEFQGQRGWSIGENTWGEMLPVVFVGNEEVESRFRIYDADNPLFNGMINFHLKGKVARVQKKDGAQLLAFIGEGDSYSPESLPAIVYWQTGKGRVYYVAYDPGAASHELMRRLLLE